jgi:ferredoxin
MVNIKVDKDKCIGCGACVSICPEVFALEGHKSVVKKNDCDGCDCDSAASACPVSAISILG